MLAQAQVTQNFNAGVGQRFYLLFDVSDATGVSQGYVMFTVAQYDSASYLFTSPTFISLDSSAKPDGIAIKGLRIGINGSIPTVGQAYIPLDTQVTAANYTAGAGQLLSKIGTVIAISSGPLTEPRPAQTARSRTRMGRSWPLMVHITVRMPRSSGLPIACRPRMRLTPLPIRATCSSPGVSP